LVFGVGWGKAPSVQASGDPEQEKLIVLAVKSIPAIGQEETWTTSVADAELHACPDKVLNDCVGEAIAGEDALLPAALAKVLEYRRVALSRVRLVLTEQPAAMQVMGSSGLQSPPFCERTWARSPLPTYARSQRVSSCTVVAAML
jgi:hypothetical protein